jgi:IS30 family transposase
MAQHRSLIQHANVKVYFAHPHGPWERGINENTNGLLRQYLPKGQDLSLFSQDLPDDIAMMLNSRIRKSPGWMLDRNERSEVRSGSLSPQSVRGELRSACR